MNKTLTTSRLAVLLLASGQTLAAAAADIFNGNTSFTTTGQSIWDSGAAFNYDYSQFFGTNYNTGSIVIDPPQVSGSIPVPVIADPTWSVDPYMTLSAAGLAGIQVGANVNGGSINANLDYNVNLAAPDVIRSGQYIALSGSAQRLASSAFNTNPVNASAYMDGRLTVNTNGYYRAVTGGTALTDGTYIARDGIPDINLTQEIAAVNRNGNGQLSVLGANVGGVGSSFDAYYGTITAGDPRLTTGDNSNDGVLSATGNTTLLTASLDVDAALTGGSPVTGLHINPNLGPDVIFNFGYDVAAFNAGLALGLAQRFDVDSSLMVTLHFSNLVIAEDGSLVDQLTGSIDSMPLFALQGRDVMITPEFWVSASLTNNTDLTFTGSLDLAVLQGQAQFIIDVDNVLYSYHNTVVNRSAGPIYGWGDTYNLGSINVLDSTFDLGGFNSWMGTAFQVTAVPLPAAAWLLVSGLLGLVGAAGRRR
ncbi:MAG TPA: hypothetical protein VIR60_04415 [Gammaproteobacteria bacterium]